MGSGTGTGSEPHCFDVPGHNRIAWDAEAQRGNRWTIPVDAAAIARARRGRWEILLTPGRPVPASWFPPLQKIDLLGLASGGGQQGPILAAAGARVTILDNSPAQLARDREVAERESLEIRTVLGDMADLSAFADASFDAIVHPVSNSFVPDVRPVWRESFRVLRPGGILLAGFSNSLVYLFDEEEMERGELRIRHALPYSDLATLPPEERERRVAARLPLEFGHTLEDLLGGMLDAGFALTALFEDRDPAEALSAFLATYLAVRAVKPAAEGRDR